MLVLLCVQVVQTNKKNLVEDLKKQLYNVNKQKICEFAKKTKKNWFKKSNWQNTQANS